MKNFGLHDDDDDNNYYSMITMITITGTGLPRAQGYYDDDDRSTDEGMHRIKPRQSFCLFPLSDSYGGYLANNINHNTYYTYIYILFLRVVSMTVWSRFYFVKIHFT